MLILSGLFVFGCKCLIEWSFWCNAINPTVEQEIIAKIGEYNQISLRISSLDEKQARGGIFQRESIPNKKKRSNFCDWYMFC